MNYTTVAVIMAETVHRSIKRSACLEHLRTVSLIGMEARGSPAPDQRAVQDGAQSQIDARKVH